MDLATIVGLIVALGAVVGAFKLEGGALSALFLASPMLIVIGGALGATIVTTSIGTVKQVPKYFRLAFSGSSRSYRAAIDYIVKLAEKARLPSHAWREGTRFWVFTAQVYAAPY